MLDKFFSTKAIIDKISLMNERQLDKNYNSLVNVAIKGNEKKSSVETDILKKEIKELKKVVERNRMEQFSKDNEMLKNSKNQSLQIQEMFEDIQALEELINHQNINVLNDQFEESKIQSYEVSNVNQKKSTNNELYDLDRDIQEFQKILFSEIENLFEYSEKGDEKSGI
ncbi:hypothetical protein [Vagococcus zengguangii]|uniref:Uncharacterized protein n=1 Tax=Vagococcus zengguangii TaxID=2571750 RepID=A0A4D7CRL4_9ENTE|nr:hypothetical protein [Vagococcus zengguangii]QCI86728.1 hypothetical protein FA707_07005 [Vagococcus zengguangii]TLG79512.1 hypothetical protein FE258_08595 [Vagococcus zengguangii]